LDEKKLTMNFTGSFEECDIQILMPDEAEVNNVILNGKVVKHEMKIIEQSKYLHVRTSKIGVNNLVIQLN
jgi:hypothetical protein